MDALKYYVFKNSLIVHEQGPGMYHFSCMLDGDSLSGLYNRHINTFMFMSKPLSAQDAKTLRDLLRLEIDKLREIGELEVLDQIEAEEEQKRIKKEQIRIRKELERIEKEKEREDKEKERL